MSGFDRSLTVVCPVALLDSANHMVNCFESCYPSGPVLGTPEDPEATHVTVRAACRESWLQKVQSIVAGWQNEAAREQILASIMPTWNAYTEAEGQEAYWLVDPAKVAAALSEVVVASTEEGWELPADKIVLYPG